MGKGTQIFRLSGGLGNQFFSFAAAYQCCKERGEIFALDVSTQEAPWFFRDFDLSHYNIRYDQKISYRLGDKWYDHLLFNHIFRRAAIGLFTPTFRESRLDHLHADIFKDIKGKHYIIGDWQREYLFSKYESDIREMYVYQDELSSEARIWMDEIKSNEQSVAVHARRGDYVELNAALGEEYFLKAVDLIAARLSDPVFYCFSEDTDWLRNVFRNTPYLMKYMDYESPHKGLEDFELMRACKHQIIANSTYSWWAAWLNDNKEKIVIHPDKNVDEYWPKGWIRI